MDFNNVNVTGGYIKTIYDELLDHIIRITDTNLYRPIAEYPLKLYQNITGTENTDLGMIQGKVLNSVVVFDNTNSLKDMDDVKVYSIIKPLVAEGMKVKHEPYYLIVLPYDIFDAEDLELQFRFLVKLAMILFDQLLKFHELDIYEFKTYNSYIYRLAPKIVILKLYARVNRINIDKAYNELKEEKLVNGIDIKVMYMNFNELFDQGQIYKYVDEMEVDIYV